MSRMQEKAGLGRGSARAGDRCCPEEGGQAVNQVHVLSVPSQTQNSRFRRRAV